MWPAATVETRPIHELILREQNPREHSLEQIEQIANSIREWGWTMPVLVDEDSVLIAGHGRVRAARLMGIKEAPVVVARGWSEDKKRAYVIADNQIASNSEWDPKRLRSELKSLVASDFNLDLVGFSDDDLSKLIIADKETPNEHEPETVVMTRCPTCGRLSREPKQQ